MSPYHTPPHPILLTHPFISLLVSTLQEEDGSIQVVTRTPKPVAPAPICGFELSRSGELMAAVTPDGEAALWLCFLVLPGSDCVALQKRESSRQGLC